MRIWKQVKNWLLSGKVRICPNCFKNFTTRLIMKNVRFQNTRFQPFLLRKSNRFSLVVLFQIAWFGNERNYNLSKIQLNFLRFVKIWLKKFATRQMPIYKSYNASDFGRKNLQTVRFRIELFTTCQNLIEISYNKICFFFLFSSIRWFEFLEQNKSFSETLKNKVKIKFWVEKDKTHDISLWKICLASDFGKNAFQKPRFESIHSVKMTKFAFTVLF